MAELSTSSDGLVAEEASQQESGQGSSEGSHGLQDTKEQEIRKGKAALVSTELLREDLVQSAVSFLKHPKVVASSDGQRRSFLENKGLTVDEIDEAFLRLQSPSSNSASSNMCTSQGVFDHSCRITEQESKVDKKCMDDSERVEPEAEPVAPVVPHHPKSYMEIMEMIQRGERPDDIQDINDDPPNSDQPISEPRMAPKPKAWCSGESCLTESPGRGPLQICRGKACLGFSLLQTPLMWEPPALGLPGETAMGKARSRKFGLGFEITTKGTRRVDIKSSARWHQQGCRVGRWLQPGGAHCCEQK